jgi:hypothetical protein
MWSLWIKTLSSKRTVGSSVFSAVMSRLYNEDHLSLEDILEVAVKIGGWCEILPGRESGSRGMFTVRRCYKATQ